MLRPNLTLNNGATRRKPKCSQVKQPPQGQPSPLELRRTSETTAVSVVVSKKIVRVLFLHSLHAGPPAYFTRNLKPGSETRPNPA